MALTSKPYHISLSGPSQRNAGMIGAQASFRPAAPPPRPTSMLEVGGAGGTGLGGGGKDGTGLGGGGKDGTGLGGGGKDGTGLGGGGKDGTGQDGGEDGTGLGGGKDGTDLGGGKDGTGLGGGKDGTDLGGGKDGTGLGGTKDGLGLGTGITVNGLELGGGGGIGLDFGKGLDLGKGLDFGKGLGFGKGLESGGKGGTGLHDGGLGSGTGGVSRRRPKPQVLQIIICNPPLSGSRSLEVEWVYDDWGRPSYRVGEYTQTVNDRDWAHRDHTGYMTPWGAPGSAPGTATSLPLSEELTSSSATKKTWRTNLPLHSKDVEVAFDRPDPDGRIITTEVVTLAFQNGETADHFLRAEPGQGMFPVWGSSWLTP